MTVFVDTSALYALFDRSDQNHDRAAHQLNDLLIHEEDLFCTNYILIEAISLLQRRIGMKAVNDFQDSFAPMLHTVWVDEPSHNAGMNALRLANRRQLSLVDCVSFMTMRRLEIVTVFAFDQHFIDQGFDCIPAN